MSVMIRTLHLTSYSMPHSCVACGAFPDPDAKLKATGGKDRWSFFGGTQFVTINLEFPLCPECNRVSRGSKLAKLVVVLGILGATALFCANAHLLGAPNSLPWFLWGLVLPIVLVALGLWLFNLINRRGLSAEQLERRKMIKKCVSVSYKSEIGLGPRKSAGYAVFEFTNESFGKQFSELNSGLIYPINGRE